MKYTPETVERIYTLLSNGEHTIEDVCKQSGISKETFYQWKENKPDFADALKKADQDRIQSFKRLARSGLAKLLDVFEYEEVTTEYAENKDGKPKVKSKKVVRKFMMPNVTAVIFTLTNQDSDNFRRNTESAEGDREPPKPLVFKPVKPDGRDS